jgi:hypothetical protein
VLTPQERYLANVKAGFDHGWDAALDEAILVLETAVFKEETTLEALQAVRNLRSESQQPR